MNTVFKIVLWNANGLNQRNLELKTFLVNHNIDVMLISETHFTEKSFLKIYNYDIYITNHPDGKAHGGTYVIIKRSIKHREIAHFKKDYLQATNVIIEDQNGPVVLSAINCPPKHSIKDMEFTEFFKTLGNRFIAGGDYNAKHAWWGSRASISTPRGRQLFTAMQKDNLFSISTGEPTYWPTDNNKLPDLIDFAIVKNIDQKLFTVKSCYDLSSDHSPVIIEINSKITSTSKTTLMYNIKTNWQMYKDYIDNNLSCNVSLKTAEELENRIEEFNVLIHEAAAVSTPTMSSNTVVKDIPIYIKKMINQKRN